MGKKGRKTRWRTLTIADEHSDSEESSTGHRVPKGYPQKSYYGRFTYSSQSTPTRRYQCDGAKSTRSSSTASENKITFNEDEYTRITTPRQDVLFKKGYLNKPKTYQTQTSTGNSTTSTGNSTGNGTPDHQSTDLEYESQFVFPNGFVDQNGIYYVNSFEPYPLMVFNPPTYYPEFTSVKSKRCSTGSLTESTSPNNEEASQSETPSNVSDFNHCYNVIYPGFYYNGACQPQDAAGQPEPRRAKKRRRRKPSRSKSMQDGTTSECTDESSDEVFSDHEKPSEEGQNSSEEKKVDAQKLLLNSLMKDKQVEEESAEEGEEEKKERKVDGEEAPKTKYDLKPDAEEFVPRAYRQPETIPMEANVQFIKIPSNFVPLHILNPMGDFNGQNFSAFIPPGIPVNFIPQNYVNYIPGGFLNKTENVQPAKQPSEKVEEEIKETVEVPKNQIDIAKIVSKLEEAAKEQDSEDVKEETNKPKGDIPKTSPNRKPTVPARNVKRNRYQKVETKTPDEVKIIPETREPKKTAWKQPGSPKKEMAPQTATPPKPVARNYSETLKRSVETQQCERHERHMEKQKLIKTTAKEVAVKNHAKIEQTMPKTADQWISVSSRKKRKNKNVETDHFEDVEEKDVEREIQNDDEAKPLEEVAPSMPPSSTPDPPTPPPPKETKPIETELVESEASPIAESIKEETKPENPEETKEKAKPVPKKKTKKTQKPLTKRIIIKDIDLSLEMDKTVKEEKTEEIPVKEEATTETKSEEIIQEEKTVKAEETVEEKIDEKKETPEKKTTKKKKKKIAKPTILSSQSSSNTTLNVIDDSYDFLLESSLLDDSQEKTNVEVSQELDKMIQRGMYSNLEEKMKSLNIESNDSFFKSLIHNISSRESSVEKATFGKTPDFSKILNSTTHLLKPKPLDPKLDFLGEAAPKTTVGGETAAESPDEKLYPITRAVKEWMTKTREITPDLEILKSPSTIFREFGELDQDRNDSLESLDDVTLYSGDEPAAPEKTTPEEDVPEVYERNEDYLKILAEVEEKKTAQNFPKHGNLPYRAICCSIM